MTHATLGVLMANYNHARYLKASIGAIVTQSRPPDEFVIIDDASTDNSWEIIQDYARQYPYIRALRNPSNLGATETANRALSLLASEYIHSAAADDLVLPGFFDTSIQVLAKFPEAGLCCSRPAYFTDTDPVPTCHPSTLNDVGMGYLSPDKVVRAMKYGKLNIAGHTSVTSLRALKAVGGYLPELKWYCDWFAHLVIGFRQGICNIPEALAAYRLSPSSYSAVGSRNRDEKHAALDRILHLLKQPAYQDVFPAFRESRAFCHHDWDLVRLIVGNPKHHDIQTLSLIWAPLFFGLKGRLADAMPASRKRL